LRVKNQPKTHLSERITVMVSFIYRAIFLLQE